MYTQSASLQPEGSHSVCVCVCICVSKVLCVYNPWPSPQPTSIHHTTHGNTHNTPSTRYPSLPWLPAPQGPGRGLMDDPHHKVSVGLRGLGGVIQGPGLEVTEVNSYKVSVWRSSHWHLSCIIRALGVQSDPNLTSTWPQSDLNLGWWLYVASCDIPSDCKSHLGIPEFVDKDVIITRDSTLTSGNNMARIKLRQSNGSSPTG